MVAGQRCDVEAFVKFVDAERTKLLYVLHQWVASRTVEDVRGDDGELLVLVCELADDALRSVREVGRIDDEQVPLHRPEHAFLVHVAGVP